MSQSPKKAWEWPDHSVNPGEHCDIAIQAGQSYSGQDLVIPAHVWRGLEPGPSVLISGALHGDEINGTGSIRELILNPEFELTSGTLLLVPVLNVPGFERHSRYLPDRRDLNRCFPGSKSGSMASRLAHTIFTEIVQRCDFAIDIHTAAIRRTNFPNIRGDLSDDRVRRMALAFGAEIIVDSRGPKGSFRRTASEAGCPTILLEAGEVWKVEPTVIEFALRGIQSVLRSLGMVAEGRYVPSFRVIAKQTRWLRADSAGFLRFHAAPGDLVQLGQTLATNTSLLGKEQNTVVSPMDGVIVGMTTLPSVSPGDPICHIAKVRQPFDQLEERVDSLADDSLHERIRADLGSSLMNDELDPS